MSYYDTSYFARRFQRTLSSVGISLEFLSICFPRYPTSLWISYVVCLYRLTICLAWHLDLRILLSGSSGVIGWAGFVVYITARKDAARAANEPPYVGTNYINYFDHTPITHLSAVHFLNVGEVHRG